MQSPKRFTSLFKEAFWAYRAQMLVMAGLGFVSGLLEAVGVNALIPLLSFVMGAERGEDDIVTRVIEKAFTLFGITFSVTTLLVFIVLLFFGKALALLLFSYLRVKIRSDYETKTRNSLLSKTFHAAWPTLISQRLGHLETILMVDVRMSAKLFEVLSDNLMLATSVLMYLLVALNLSWQVTLATLLVGLLVLLFARPLLFRIRRYSVKTAMLNKDVSHLVGESMLGMKSIKALQAAGALLEKGVLQFDALRRYQIRASLFGTLSVVFIQPLSVLFIAGVFAFSFYYTPGISFAALAALIYLIYRIFTYVQTVQGNIQHITSLTPYVEATLAFEREIGKHPEKSGGTKPFMFERELRLDHISFEYEGGEKVLRDVDTVIRKGELIGVIGVSGVGKTTLFDLLLRLLEPTEGAIRVDGADATDISMVEWRREVGYVSQDVFLLNDTIENNIRFFDERVSVEDIEEAAKLSQVSAFADSFPDGLKTIVGERGARLSAGQRQRIAIARVLARKPSILLLDEATSALDSESEQAIQKAIEGLKGKVTVLIIAHRLSTVRNCDRLFVIEGGKIAEEGKPEELLKDKESYFYRAYHIRT